MNALYIVTVYVTLDDCLRTLDGYHDDVRARVTGAEVLTVAVVAARYFQNHHERALSILVALGWLPRLSVSRFNRRLHGLQPWLRALMDDLRQAYLTRAAEREVYVVDAFPLPVCKRHRQRRCRKVRGDAYLGYCDAKREWFFGFKLHWRCDLRGVPLSCALLPARMHEQRAIRVLLASVPAGSIVLGDGSYVSDQRARAWRHVGIRMITRRYGRMRPNSASEKAWLARRMCIEVAHSQLEKMGIQRLHAPTLDGFVLKVGFSLLALLFMHLLPTSN